MDMSHILGRKSLVLIFAYAPAGLGHLRVSDALYHGLPKTITPLLLGAHDKSINTLYRFISIHPLTRFLMSFAEQGIAQDIFTYWYRLYLRSHTQLLHEQMSTILEERLDLPQTVLIIATHFGLAHQLAEIKNKLEEEKNIRIFLLVQVTDDSPLSIWYVPGADMIFVPSNKTMRGLAGYGKAHRLPDVPFVVNPYPISPLLTQPLTDKDYQEKVEQMHPARNTCINMAIPISGSAVNTASYTALIDALVKKSKRFTFHITVKDTSYTKDFLSQMLARESVALHTSSHDRGIVDAYEQMYKHTTIALEVTKPSEQTFKALLRPRSVGGVLLLFSDPVGKHEEDNLDFLRRHHLIPTKTKQNILWEKASKNDNLDNDNGEILLKEAQTWRGLKLPSDPVAASHFIVWCLQSSIFKAMMAYHHKRENKDDYVYEIKPDGVKEFWEKTARLLQTKT